jgi:hypothetical protein
LQDHALDGSATEDPSAAVLTPVARLEAALLAAGEYEVEPWDPYVASIGGYRSNGQVQYSSPTLGVEDDEQAYLDAFGVLPGCETPQPFGAPLLRAGPGGRLAAATSEGSTFSICDDDWTQALDPLASRMRDVLRPWCIEFECVADRSPDDPLLEPDCVFEEVDDAAQRWPVPTCERDADGWRIDPLTHECVIPADADTCWVWRTDAEGLTETPTDDTYIACSDRGWLGNVQLARRPGGARLPYDSHYELRCRPCE